MGEALKPLICNKSKILVLEKLGIGGEAWVIDGGGPETTYFRQK